MPFRSVYLVQAVQKRPERKVCAGAAGFACACAAK